MHLRSIFFKSCVISFVPSPSSLSLQLHFCFRLREEVTLNFRFPVVAYFLGQAAAASAVIVDAALCLALSVALNFQHPLFIYTRTVSPSERRRVGCLTHDLCSFLLVFLATSVDYFRASISFCTPACMYYGSTDFFFVTYFLFKNKYIFLFWCI